MIKVLFICHGNICRSTMAESVFTHLVGQRGLKDQFKIYSAGVSREELGAGVHRGTRQVLKEKGVPVVEHFADQVTWRDYHHYDYLICMDHSNIKLLNSIIGGDYQNKVHLLLSFIQRRSFTSDSSSLGDLPPDVSIPNDLRADMIPDIADPWYTGDYEATYRDILAGCDAFLDYLVEKEHLKN